ncbi:MAG TPA: hypothetical protein VLJ58_07950 [Ramlibacter sp.]|nr:hypothetical protein [Ramlibacter sp.]
MIFDSLCGRAIGFGAPYLKIDAVPHERLNVGALSITASAREKCPSVLLLRFGWMDAAGSRTAPTGNTGRGTP